MPTAATTTWSAANRLDPVFNPEDAKEIDVALAASLTYVKGTVLGEVTATPGTFKPYASGNVDGSEIPKLILRYACVTDASGNITLLGEQGQTYKAVPAFMNGFFKTSELTGMDANAVTKLGAALVSGNLTTGIIRI